MSIKFTRLLSCFLCSVAATTTATVAAAGPFLPPVPRTDELELTDIGDAFERAFNSESGTYFQNRSLLRRMNFIFGIGNPIRFRGSYPENEIDRDAEHVHILYNEFLRQQLERGPVIRTRDLENPYQFSLGTGVVDPAMTPPRTAAPFVPAPSPQAPPPPPVRALW